MKLSENLNKMFSPISLGTWFGVPVSLHWSWWVLALFLLVVSPINALTLVGVGMIVIMHEFGHIFGGRYVHIRAESVTMYIFGGVASMRFTTLSPRQEFITTVCGPLVNVALMPIFALIAPYNEVLSKLHYVNILILCFNLLPAFPMDGGRILRAFLGNFYKIEKATRIVVSISNFVLLGVGLFGVYCGSLNLVAIALFMYDASRQELDRVIEKTTSKRYLSESQRALNDLSVQLNRLKK